MEKGNKKEIAAAVDPKTNLNSGFSVSPLILCRRVSLSLIFLALTLAILGCSVNHCDATALSMFPHPLLPPSPPVPVPENLVTQAHDTRSGLEALLQRTLNALQRAMLFFDRVHKHVILDSTIGTRIVADQLAVLLQRHFNDTGSLIWLPEYRQKIIDLQELSKTVSDKSIFYIAVGDPPYYRKIGNLLRQRFWEINHRTRTMDMSLQVPFDTKGKEFEEEESDNCLAEFFGSRPGATRICDISDKCWLKMTAPGYIGYSLSHEVFYLQIGQQFGCSRQMNEKVMQFRQPSVDILTESFCVNMLIEAKSFAAKGFSPVSNDLFMEQAALCGMQGYYQFFTTEWLEHILSWQSTNGCYKGWPLEYIKGPSHRAKREEKVLDGGCMCHRTTVASAALVQYVRYLAEALATSRA